MDTVTTEPPYGSVEHYAELIRRNAHAPDHVYPVVVGAIDSITATSHIDAVEKVKRVRNALAATELVYAELAAR